MTVFSPDWTPSPLALRRAGAVVLWVGLGIGLLGVLGAVWLAPDWSPLLPLAAVGVVTVGVLLRHPDLHLFAVLLASVAVLEHQPGVQPQEVVYGLYVIFFLAIWVVTDLHGRRTLLASREARLMAGFLILAVALVPMAFLQGGLPHTVVREMTSLTMLGFFFPIRDLCVRRPEAVRTLVGIGLVLSVFVVVRNLLMYQAALGSAERLGELIGRRIIANDHVLAAGTIVGFVFLLHARRLSGAAIATAVFMLNLSGLVLTLSRGFWLATVWGMLFVFVTVSRAHKARMAVVILLASVPVLAIGLLFFGNIMSLFFEGLLERLTSVDGSLTRDVSMLGRVYEARAAFGHIVENPLLGHGAGVPFTFSTILTRTETTTTFIHNGYVYLWYVFGVVGVVLMLALWWRAIWSGWSAYRVSTAPWVVRLAGLGAAASLFAFTLSAMTSNPFFHKDYLLGLAFHMALAYGVRAQVAATHRPAVVPPSP